MIRYLRRDPAYTTYKTDANGDTWVRPPIGVLMDDEDWERTRKAKENWTPVTTNGVTYLQRSASGADKWAGNKRCVYMHQDIMRPVPGYITHHKNGNGLDNRRENLENVTFSQHRRFHLKQRKQEDAAKKESQP